MRILKGWLNFLEVALTRNCSRNVRERKNREKANFQLLAAATFSQFHCSALSQYIRNTLVHEFLPGGPIVLVNMN